MTTYRIDELQLQRLVDGELNDQQRRDFLVAVDEHPENWREVALALVEEQVWQNALASRGDAVSMSVASVSRLPSERVGRSIGRWATMALGLLVLLAISYFAGTLRQQTPVTAEQPQGSSRAVAKENAEEKRSHLVPVPPRDRVVPQPPMRVQMVGADGSMFDLPVFDDEELDVEAWQPQNPPELEALNDQLQSLGYRIEYETEYLSGRLGDGRELWVPIRNANLRYHGQ